MLGDERRQSGPDGVGKELSEDAKLFGHPSRVLESQFFDADFMFEEIHVLPELSDGVSRRRLLERNPTNFVVDVPGDRFDLQHVTVVHAQLFDMFEGLVREFQIS